ncbi:hypothetical protein ACIPW9_27200 [Streptomyces sp. NPDC090052]|nr:hypothetical protein [Streptomyces sp. NBC_01306]MCX4725164.1 hypothetical protein [Streptomyces sp. NBC_01306]
MLAGALAAGLLTITSATSASAAGAVLIADRPGAHGNATVKFASKTYANSVYLRVVDLKADGHHVEIRLITKHSDGSIAFWPWHANYGGSTTEKEWNSSLTDAKGIVQARIQVCVYEGSQVLDCAFSPFSKNTYWN